MIDLSVPDSLRKAIYFLRGYEDGEQWLAGLPAVWSTYSSRWALEPQVILEGGAMSCCLLCRDSSSEELVVLKIPSDSKAGVVEAAAMAVWSENGASPPVLQTDPLTGVYVMEYVAPGSVSLSDPLAMAALLERLNVAREWDYPFDPIATNVAIRSAWARARFDTKEYESESRLLPEVDELAKKLLRSKGLWGLIHGDLQTKNVLATTNDRLVAIDPFACVGDLHYDAAMWAVTQSNPVGVRELICDLAAVWAGCDLDRILQWARVLVVLEYRPYQEDRRDRFLDYLNQSW